VTTEAPQEAVLVEPRLAERWQALVDILYLSQVTWLYVFSLIYPVVGLFFGILLLAGGISAPAKKVGRICLILGIINTVLVIIGLILTLVLGLTGALAGLGKD
jgi:fumarate reductase subunit D